MGRKDRYHRKNERVRPEGNVGKERKSGRKIGEDRPGRENKVLIPSRFQILARAQSKLRRKIEGEKR